MCLWGQVYLDDKLLLTFAIEDVDPFSKPCGAMSMVWSCQNSNR